MYTYICVKICMYLSVCVRLLSTVYNDVGDLNMWVDYRGSLSTVYNGGEISTCG